MQTPRYRIRWSTPTGELLAIEPHRDEVAQHAALLAAAYNDPHNAALLGHTEAMTEADVIAHYAEVSEDGGHNFLVFRNGQLVADADLRGVADGAAEFAFMVAAVAAQGQGLGTKTATMIHAFAFAQLRLDRVYASVVPENVASRRVLEKLGCTVDPSPAARSYADDPGDIVMVIDRPAFEHLHAPQMAEIQIAVR